MNKWHKPETYFAALSIGIATLIATPFAQSIPPWAFALAVSLLAVLQLLAGNGTADKALQLPPPKIDPKIGGTPPKTRLPVLLLLLLPLLAGCSNWRQTTIRGLWVAHEVSLASQRAAPLACVATRTACTAQPCPKLETCKATRRKALQGVESLDRALELGRKAVAAGCSPAAAKVLQLVMQAAGEVCKVLKLWNAAPAACSMLGGA